MATRRNNLKGLLVLSILAVVIAGILYGAFILFGSSDFEKKYAEYVLAEEEYVEVANKPAAEANPVRRQVYTLLAEVLQVEMTPEERIAKAKQGIAHLNDMEGQIDAIKSEADKVSPLLAELEKNAGGISNRSEKRELVRLGKRQIEIISDIRGLSYRADYYTSEVFERIIDDQGAMTDEHKTYLNDLIPQLEEQFDNRSNLYAELDVNANKMTEIAREIGL